uniref:Chemokine (C-X-C motif) ligand 18a, duplicate 1 n=1 Tax=Electrophorus electricus TaxID=8005 RepID=A0A4W4GRL7_ELEEL
THMRTNNFLIMLRENRIAGTTIRKKCECITVKNFVKWNSITDFKVIMPEPICNRVQIILRTPSKSLCLAPGSKQGKRLQQCWKNKTCFYTKRVNS